VEKLARATRPSWIVSKRPRKSKKKERVTEHKAGRRTRPRLTARERKLLSTLTSARSQASSGESRYASSNPDAEFGRDF